MSLRFTLSKRPTLPTERTSALVDVTTGQPISPSASQAQTLIPRLQTNGRPVDAGTFFDHCPWNTVVNKSLMQLCLCELRKMLLHELGSGSSVYVPGIGTLSVTLRGDVELRGDTYHGADVRVDNLRFVPDRDLLQEVRGFEVDQEPLGRAYSTTQVDVDGALARLFADHDTITRRDLEYAFGLVVSKHRLTDLLNRLVAQGRLIKEGRGSQTRYRQLSPSQP